MILDLTNKEFVVKNPNWHEVTERYSRQGEAISEHVWRYKRDWGYFYDGGYRVVIVNKLTPNNPK